jgi:putative membrane protein
MSHLSLKMAMLCTAAGVALSLPVSAADLSAADKDFMKNTAIAGMTEIKLGHVAEKNSSNKQVLDFAAKMISDHTNASNNLKKVASEKSVPLPASLDVKHQGIVDKLSKLKGAKFDNEYMKQMAEDHKAVVASIEAEQKVARDSLKNFCDQTLPVVQGHLKMADDWVSNRK